MSCECDHTVCCGLLSASDSATASLREIYRRPPRRRYPRHISRRRLLHQHMSCPNTFARSDELSTTSADELSAWASRRTRSDLPPMGAGRRYKTDRSKFSMRPPRIYPLPASRRGSSRHRRTTTIVHHPCCLFDPKLCPVMKGSQHRQRLRPEDIDSDTLRTTEELRSHIESFLYQHQRRQPQKAPCQPEAAAQFPAKVPQHQSKPMKSAQQGDPHEKKCEICGNPQHFTESTAQFPHRYRRQPSPPAAAQPYDPAEMLARDVSSETAGRLVDELSRRSAGPRTAHTPQRVTIGDQTGQQRNPTSGAKASLFPASPTSTGPRKGEASLMTNIKTKDIALSPPLGDIHRGLQNMPRPRSAANSPFLEEYFSRRPSLVLERGNEMHPQAAVKTGPPITQVDAAVKTGPPITQLDVEASYTMHSLASARAAATKNPESANRRRYTPSGAYSYEEEIVSQPENVTINFQQATRRAASDGAKPSDSVFFSPSSGKGIFTFGSHDADDSRNHVGHGDTEFRVMPQSEPDSARFTAGTYETDASGLQQTGNLTVAAGSSSSNGDFQSGNQTPAGSGGSLRHMDGVEKALKSWQASGSDAAQVNGLQTRTDKLSSPVASVCRAPAAGELNHLPGFQRASPLASTSSRKSVISPTPHWGEGNHQEADVRKSGNTCNNNVKVTGSDDSAVYSRHSYVESLSKPDDCGDYTYRSNVQQAEKPQETARNASRGGTPRSDSGYKATLNAEQKTVARSRATSRSGSIAASTKTARRRAKDGGGGDGKVCASQSDDAQSVVAIATSHLSVSEQVEASRNKIIECIDKALALIVNSSPSDFNNIGCQPNLQSTGQLMARSKSTRTENGDSSDMEKQRECSTLELSSELWGHVDTTVRDSLSSLPQLRASKGAAISPAEDRNNRKLLLKLQRDLTKNILTNLERLEDIESLLHPSMAKDQVIHQANEGPPSK
ncbi:uncharacterized protein LOC126354140 isoform X2 [Schistocerca gregaria]|uniref:uncharacterized protein LOC126354140 isoform X2 n=1 Tax=Schistocerca gregaria TaxID=7010 RepID=UPI00211E4FAA|nr:uncharacterized protein LOC126354140 isoform X2 [Schistocerca gregaria]